VQRSLNHSIRRLIKGWQNKLLALAVLAALLVSPAAWAQSRLLDVSGLPGLSAVVAAHFGASAEADFSAISQTAEFTVLPGFILEHSSYRPIWLRIDLAVPPELLGQTAWLQLLPAYLAEVQVNEAGGKVQLSGYERAVSRRNLDTIAPTFALVLSQPTTRVYVRIAGAGLQLTHLHLMSLPALHHAQQNTAVLHAIFYLSALWMLLINLINWVWTRDPIYRGYFGYLCSLVLVLLCLDGYVSAFVLPESPMVVLYLMIFTGWYAVAGTIFMGLRFVNVDAQLPRLAVWLRRAGWLALVVPLLSFDMRFIPFLIEGAAATQMVIGMLMLVLSARQAWVERSQLALLVFLGYLAFTGFEQVPLLAMFGPMPVSDRTLDYVKVGILVQLLMLHLLLLAKLRQARLQKMDIDLAAGLAAAELKAAQQQRVELNRFLGMLGHELRTPLAVIDSAVQSLELQPGADEPDRAVRHSRIRLAVRRLDRLVSDAMLRERIESSVWKLRLATCSDLELIQAALAQFELDLPIEPLPERLRLPLAIAGQAGGWLELLGADRTASFSADLPLMQIALGNLLDNACKYADPRSTIRLQVINTPSAPGVAAAIRFEVFSQGPALAAVERAQVFEKYWRRDEQREVGGAGLGLHLVRHIMVLHGGDADVRSLPDRWTCFGLQLPLLPT
jgi:signal transduction histidine kinase